MQRISSGDRVRAIIVGSGDRRPQIKPLTDAMTPLITQFFDVVAVDFEYKIDLTKIAADLVIVVGGDGSILRAAKKMQHQQLPVLAVNLGRLGFLADLQPDSLEATLVQISRGEFTITDHLMFECRVFRGERRLGETIGLNELAIMGGPPFSIQNIDLYIDSKLATSYSCDGLIISTPVGSTAHNLSAGGPIIRKSLQAFVISPISPHTLTVRPVVDTADRTYEMVVREPNESTSAVVDGRVLSRLTSDDRVQVRRAKPTFQLIEVSGHNYYRTLREKLGWGGEFTQRSAQFDDSIE